MLNDLLPDYSDSEVDGFEIEKPVERCRQPMLSEVYIPMIEEVDLNFSSDVDNICVPITPYSSPRKESDDEDYDISPVTIRTEFGDGLMARACGFGSYDHNGGFEVFDSPIPRNSIQRTAPSTADGDRYELLYVDAFRRDKRLRAKQAMKSIRKATEEERIISKNKPARLPQKKVEFICNNLSSTVGRDRRIRELAEERDKDLLKDCTFHPKINTLEHSKYFNVVPGRSSSRSTSRSRSTNGRSSSASTRMVFTEEQSKRLHTEAASRTRTLNDKLEAASRQEKRQREIEKRKANPAYAERVRKKAEKRALEKKIFDMMRIAEQQS